MILNAAYTKCDWKSCWITSSSSILSTLPGSEEGGKLTITDFKQVLGSGSIIISQDLSPSFSIKVSMFLNVDDDDLTWLTDDEEDDLTPARAYERVQC